MAHIVYYNVLLLLSGELSLQVLVAPSLVAPGKGLFLCIYDDIDDDSEDVGAVEEIIIPQGKFFNRSLNVQIYNAASSSFNYLQITRKALRYVGTLEDILLMKLKRMAIKVLGSSSLAKTPQIRRLSFIISN